MQENPTGPSEDQESGGESLDAKRNILFADLRERYDERLQECKTDEERKLAEQQYRDRLNELASNDQLVRSILLPIPKPAHDASLEEIREYLRKSIDRLLRAIPEPYGDPALYPLATFSALLADEIICLTPLRERIETGIYQIIKRDLRENSSDDISAKIVSPQTQEQMIEYIVDELMSEILNKRCGSSDNWGLQRLAGKESFKEWWYIAQDASIMPN